MDHAIDNGYEEEGSLAHRVDAAADRFEAALHRGAGASISDFLPAGPPGPRNAVLAELVRVGMEHSWHSGNPKTLASFIEITPEISSLGPEVLAELSLLEQKLQQLFCGPDTVGFTGGAIEPHAGHELEYRSEDAGELPKTLRGYVVQGELARGGMGTVLLCRDTSLRRPVAVKILRTEHTSEEIRLRFVEEAQVTGQLEHPNIVPVHQLGEDSQGRPFFSMKLVRGRSLKQILEDAKERNSAADLAEWLQVFLKVCDAVAFAHARGVIHRDLKPANIMVGDFGEVLVMDWGLAKVMDRGAEGGPDPSSALTSDEDAAIQATSWKGHEQDSSRENARGAPSNLAEVSFDAAGEPVSSVRTDSDIAMTMEGTITGTPAYMSPEQASGNPGMVDHRSDIYSLGAILYSLLTLEAPVHGKTIPEIIARARDGRIERPEKRTPGRHIPAELSAITMKALSTRPGDRYQTAKELANDIMLYFEGRAVSAKEDTFLESLGKLVRRNKGISVAIGVAAFLILLLSTVFVLSLVRERNRAQESERHALLEKNAAELARRGERETATNASRRFAYQAIRAAEQARWSEARIFCDAARAMLPRGPWGLFAKGLVALRAKDLENARKHLEEARKIAPSEPAIRNALAQILALEGRLKEALAIAGEPGSATSWRDILSAAEVLYAQEKYKNAITAFSAALRQAEKAGDTPPGLNARCKAHIEHAKAWLACRNLAERMRGLGPAQQLALVRQKLAELHHRTIRIKAVTERGVVAIIDISRTKARFLQPLAGLHLRELNCSHTDVDDLSPLRGTPLRTLKCRNTRVSSLAPLKGMPLEELDCYATPVWSLVPLSDSPLKILNCAKTKVCDLAPLRTTMLKELNCSSTGIRDISPLEGLPLETLAIYDTEVSDLSPLRRAHLLFLSIQRTKVRSLTPLAGMKLKVLKFGECREIRDLSPLRGMPLEEISFYRTSIRDVSPLAGMPLRRIHLANTEVSDLSPLKGMPIEDLVCYDTLVHDISPLKGMRFTNLELSGTRVKDLTPLGVAQVKRFSPPPRDMLSQASLRVIDELIAGGCRVVWK